MKRIYKLLWPIVMWGISFNNVFAYEVNTHAEMSGRAAQQSASATRALNDVGLGSLSSQRLIDRTILDWIQYGSIREDDIPGLRFNNHFYDPLTGLGLRWLVVAGAPSPSWGLEDTVLFPQQQFSLADASTYFYRGLTSSLPRNRELNLARSFRAIGHVVHLVQDAAQPQHTRNDAHIDGSAYEGITDALIPRLIYSGYPQSKPTVMFNNARSFWHALTPVRDLQAVRALNSDPAAQGMAEYSNRGFVSAGTNFRFVSGGNATTDPSYPMPAYSPASAWSADISEIAKSFLDCDVQPPIQPLALRGQLTFFKNFVVDSYDPGSSSENPYTSTLSVFDADLQRVAGRPGRSFFSLNRFNYCAANEYLIRRAVAYSAGLIDYFFRGRLEVDVIEENGRLRVTVKNTSGDNNVFRNGVFELYYEATDGTRKSLPALSDASIGQTGLMNNESLVLLSINPNDIDVSKTNPFILVFRGEIGLERGVAGKVFPKKTVGRVYVSRQRTGSGDGQIQIFTKTGIFVSEFGPPPSGGEGSNEFSPFGIAIDTDNIYVTDPYNHRVLIFTKSGAFVSQFGTAGQAPGEFFIPIGIAVDQDFIYVANTHKGLEFQVEKFTKSGVFISSFVGPPDSQASGAVTVDDQYVYAIYRAVDGTDAQVLNIYTKTGSLVSQFPLDNLGNVIGVAIDTSRIYLAWEGDNGIQILSRSGAVISQFGTSGEEAGQFEDLKGIALDSSHIYATDERTNRVQIFTKEGVFASQFGPGDLDEDLPMPAQVQHPAGIAVEP